MRERQQRRLQRTVRGASSLFVLVLLAASGCNDEVGGDGYVPDAPKAGKGGMMMAVAGAQSGGGSMSEGGAAGDAPSSSGKGGGSHAGSAGKASGGRGGGGSMTDGGMGGDSGAVCGNMQVEAGEECDDGNTKSGDGCTADCKSGCEVCEKTYCTAVHAPFTPTTANFYKDCFEMPGVAQAGKAPGIERKVLCQAVVDCVRKERCAQFLADDDNLAKSTPYQFISCFCDRNITEPSYTTHCATAPSGREPDEHPNPDDNAYIEGKCSQQFLEASERNTIAEALNGLLTAQLKPLGAANLLLLECDRKLCLEECFPEASSGAVAQITADILSTPNGAGESPLGDLIADSQRAALNTDFALLNVTTFQPDFASDKWGFFFKATEGRAADADGRLLESEISQVLFGIEIRNGSVNLAGGTKLVTLQMTGQQLYDFLNAQLGIVDVSGLTYTWDATLPMGSRVAEVRKTGAPIDKAAAYSVAVNNQLAASISGAANMLVSDKNPAKELIAYLKGRTQPIAPPSLDRVTRLN